MPIIVAPVIHELRVKLAPVDTKVLTDTFVQWFCLCCSGLIVETTVPSLSFAWEDPLMDMKLEVFVIPVSDVDRARRFYAGLGWRLDPDFRFE